jgi:hypothetical protein
MGTMFGRWVRFSMPRDGPSKVGVIFSAAAAKAGDNSVRFMLQEVESVKNLGTETRALQE